LSTELSEETLERKRFFLPVDIPLLSGSCRSLFSTVQPLQTQLLQNPETPKELAYLVPDSCSAGWPVGPQCQQLARTPSGSLAVECRKTLPCE